MAFALALSVAAFGGCSDDDDKAADPVPEARATKGKAIAVELAVTSRSARWEPDGDEGRGKLVLDGVSPRMAVLANAPRKAAATVPASFLRAHWEALFGKQESSTNALLSIAPDGDQGQMIALAVELADAHVSGRSFSFDAEALDDRGLKSHALGDEDRDLGEATLLIDPSVTDAIKNLWASLVSFFSGQSLSVPDAPIYRGEQRGWTFDNGGEAPGEGVYAGPLGQAFTGANWAALEKSILDGAGGNWTRDLKSGTFDPVFSGSEYRGLALFGSQDTLRFGTIDFAPTGGRVVVRDSALYLAEAGELNINHGEFGGVNMRGLDANKVTVSNTLFDTVDMTAAFWGNEAGRSTVENSAFVRARAGLRATDPDGNPDVPTGKELAFDSVDFVSTTFQDSSLPGVRVQESTFQGCGFQNVEFRGAQFQGQRPRDNNRTFEPTFDNSIFDGVSFDGARLENVSFAGVDFSAGNISFDGATFDTVDFTGAIGLQNLDFSNVTIEGSVWGLGPYKRGLADGTSPDLVRSITFDGKLPAIDVESGWDMDPEGRIVHPDSGVRLRRTSDGKLRPIDPRTGKIMTDPADPRQQLSWEPSSTGSGIFNPENQREVFRVDYLSGELIR